MHVILWVFRATDLWMAASTCCLKIIHQDMSSVLNYVPCVPSCPTCLGALLVKVFYVLTCLTCLRAFVVFPLMYLSFFSCLTWPHFFTRLTCLHFFYVSYVLASFFTCLTCPHFLRVLPDSFFICFRCLHCFISVSNFWRVLRTFTFLYKMWNNLELTAVNRE